MADALASLRDLSGVRVLSTDVFDTVLLRDRTTETERLGLAARRAARRLGVDEYAMRRLRWDAHDAAYRAVALVEPTGDAVFSRIAVLMARTLGLDSAAADVIHDAEIEVDIEHLRVNRPLFNALQAARARGTRVVAVSDTYYSSSDLRAMFAAVLPADLYDEVYTSADLGRTKHAGGIFSIVAEQERVEPREVLHIGDHPVADVRNAASAGWRTVHLPRSYAFRAQRLVGAVGSLPSRVSRSR